ncbi:uncharacterized protein Z518_11203 [Rhinocladiella mackenziei CBS 650.93]|uniref:Cytochrome P450 monooxygenase n=1 Tax=Rhinocladiella mackenziei CBS 650.93 TaxID=1442369 RepID=A0A0D2IRW6_9EURO|nr:uncharacterized protein Z518_11203 [Rhinocladiella mackenziei CBS 650.93]KIW99464.1 hypothetical protein Z518_11203 [Rhinocladiella mackenziei CBS 650.93]
MNFLSPFTTDLSPVAIIITPIVLVLAAYIVYYRFGHPLSRYPGPVLASFTNLWKAYQLWTLHMPENLTKLHDNFGGVVRVGPNDLSFNTGGAVFAIYKGGRSLPKTGFYDGFTTFNPNLFGTKDEDISADGPWLLISCASTGGVFDLKELIAFFVLDVLGELAFSRSFDSQTQKCAEKLPPINDHIFFGCLLGMMPEMMPYLKAMAAWTPLPWLQRLTRSRAQLKNLTAECVARRLNEKVTGRKDLLTALISAVDPETGERLTELQINTEAFAMVVAGSHTTSGTLTLLFSHLLRNPAILEKVVAEIDTNVCTSFGEPVQITGLEQCLPYSMACINENFRINPAFTMPLPRTVTAPAGTEIDGHWVPKGTAVFSLNHVVHHNPAIWGSDHDIFDPSRFLGPQAEYFKQNLTPFSVGHRMCIGRNMAMTNILKTLTTVLKNYTLEMEDPKQKISTLSVGISEKEGPLKCRVKRRY